MKLILALILTLSLLSGTIQVEAKFTYGPCIETYILAWMVGDFGPGEEPASAGLWLFQKIWANCDKEGGWR